MRSTGAAWAQPADPQPQPLTLQVQSMRQEATYFAPQGPPPSVDKRRPGVVVLHSGFLGDEGVSKSIANALRSRGVHVVVPAYRGERRALDREKSEGKIEFCSGEVDEAQKSVAWLRAQPDVDPLRIGLLGLSHGGCIALRTAIREPRLRAVATFAAPVAAEPLVQHLHDHPYGFFFYSGILEQQLLSYIHGPPHSEPGSYGVRSPLFLAQKLTMPLFIVHGTADQLVPTTQSCWLAQVLKQSGRTVSEQWLGKDGKRMSQHPDRCQLGHVPASTATLISPPPRTELWLVQGQNHIFFSTAAKRAAHERAIAFLLEELTRETAR